MSTMKGMTILVVSGYGNSAAGYDKNDDDAAHVRRLWFDRSGCHDVVDGKKRRSTYQPERVKHKSSQVAFDLAVTVVGLLKKRDTSRSAVWKFETENAHGGPGAFDITIRAGDEIKTVIEVDGPHHFGAWYTTCGHDEDGRVNHARAVASDLKKEAFLKKQNIRLLRLTDEAARRVADQEWIVDEILEPTEPDALVVCNPADKIYTAAGSGYAAARCSGP